MSDSMSQSWVAPTAYTPALILALTTHGDQATSSTFSFGPVAVTVGIRNVYLEVDGDVVALVKAS